MGFSQNDSIPIDIQKRVLFPNIMYINRLFIGVSKIEGPILTSRKPYVIVTINK